MTCIGSTVRVGASVRVLPAQPFSSLQSCAALATSALTLHSLMIGPVVRVSPSEVAISDLAATKKIHKVGSGFLKSPWYQEFAPSNGLTNLFTCIDPHAHAQRRRLLGQPLSESALYQSFEPYVASRVDLAVQKIGEEIASTRKYANCHKWWRFMAADVISGLSFGQSFGTLEGGQVIIV